MKRLSKEAEERILNAVSDVLDLVTGGSTPNQAIVKIASEKQIPLGHVQLMVQAYNTGKTNSHRKQANSVLEAAEEFPIADFQAISKTLFPEHVKTAQEEIKEQAFSSEYSRAPYWIETRSKNNLLEKQASFAPLTDKKVEYPEDPFAKDKKAFFKHAHNLRLLEDKRRELYSAHNSMLTNSKDLIEYFQKFASSPFLDVRRNAELKYGLDRVKPLFDHLVSQKPYLAKQASNRIHAAQGEPYILIERALEAGDLYKKIRGEYDLLVKQAEESSIFKKTSSSKNKHPILGEIDLSSEKESTPRFFLYRGDVLDPIPIEKIALFGETFGNIAKAFTAVDTVQDVISNRIKGKPEDKLLEGYLNKLNDPVHEMELRNIHTEAMLNDLLANDEVIGNHKPEDVVRLYNEVSNIAPRLSSHPMAMRSILRKHLAQGGNIDPYEIDLMTGLENKLKIRDNPVNNYGVLPNSSDNNATRR